MTFTDPLALPGAEPFEDALAARLRAALAAQAEGYTPRTHHLRPDGAPKYINRLIFETSPYLLQHAHNPVSWYPWGEEAFARAKALDRPILLSIGYSTCHWCHVMERESFEDEQIAAYINANYVAIKVDREERPDVDSVYMTVVQMMTGRGGWPMTVIMTPDKVPFFGGTYFPARDGDRGARVGFATILARLKQAYDQEREEVLASAKKVSEALARASRPDPSAHLPPEARIVELARHLAGRFDPVHGGFGAPPKFPRPSDYELLLRYARRTDDEGALHVVTHSLTRMADGGIYDHLAGGFARYSTDARWLVPHFEKMLYDNAQLATLYVEAWQASGDPRFRAVSEDVLDYVRAEMTAPEGGFYSATDADSEGEEGKFFVWTPEELTGALGEARAKIAAAYWGVTEAGNFEGKNILHRARPEAEIAEALGLEVDALRAEIAAARSALYEARKTRVPPLLDDKILTEWNGQMISAFARAGFAFARVDDLATARAAAEFVLEHLQADGRLLRAYRAGEARHGAVLEDYAFFIAGLLDLFEATSEARWLDEALRLEAVLERHYLDADRGGFFSTPDDGEALLVRDKPDYDGAQPSGNSVAALNLLRLHALTEDPRHRATAEGVLRALAENLERQTPALPKLACALDWAYDEPKEVVLAATDDDDGAALKAVLRSSFAPNKVQVLLTPENRAALTERIPWLEGKVARGGKATAYVCRGRVCEQPTTEPDVLAAQLAEHRRLDALPLPLPTRR